jgi:hypothetical protein
MYLQELEKNKEEVSDVSNEKAHEVKDPLKQADDVDALG